MILLTKEKILPGKGSNYQNLMGTMNIEIVIKGNVLGQ